MAQGQLRSFLSLIALVCLIGGTFATALGLMKISEDSSSQMITDEEYIIPAVVGNTLCVIFLVWLTATIPTRSTAYKFIVILFLIFGLIGEIYMTFYFTQPPNVYGTYVLVVTNFLIRTFFVLEFVQDTWSPVSWNDYLGAPKPASSGQPKPSGDKKPEGEKKSEGEPSYKSDLRYRETKDKLRLAIDKMKLDSKGFDVKSEQQAFTELSKNLKDGKSFDDSYRAAKGALKYKDGTAYTGASRSRA